MHIFNHFNFNVLDLEKSLKFYEEALGLKLLNIKEADDGSFKLAFLGDKVTGFRLELTWLRDRKEPYNLGDLEYHLAFYTSDYEESYRKHSEMGAIVFENKKMGVYFITDPDGYWIEITPVRP